MKKHFLYFLLSGYLLLSSYGSVLNAQAQEKLVSTDSVETNLSWPSFLGVGRQGVREESLPVKWTKDSNIAWSTLLQGHGQSSPVVWKDTAYVTTVDGLQKEKQWLYAINIHTGEIHWKQSFDNSFPIKNSYYVSRAAPTPVVDPERVIAYFESGDCIALDHDGKVLWQRALGKDYGPIVAEFGIGASPCQNRDSLFILIEHEATGVLLSLDKRNGETRWSVPRKAAKSWSSPAFFEVEGQEQVVISSDGPVQSYDVADGSALWTLEGVGGNTNVTPLDYHEGMFLIGASPGRQSEGAETAKRSNGLVQIKKGDSGWNAKLVWFNEKLAPTWGSPIIHQGYAYWVNRVGVVHCVDLQSGEILFNGRLKQSCWATPFPAGDRIYFFGKEGLCTVIASGPEWKVLSENELFDIDSLPPETTIPEAESTEERRRAAANFSSPTLYGFAVAGDTFVVRIGHEVFGVRNQK